MCVGTWEGGFGWRTTWPSSGSWSNPLSEISLEISHLKKSSSCQRLGWKITQGLRRDPSDHGLLWSGQKAGSWALPLLCLPCKTHLPPQNLRQSSYVLCSIQLLCFTSCPVLCCLFLTLPCKSSEKNSDISTPLVFLNLQVSTDWFYLFPPLPAKFLAAL